MILQKRSDPRDVVVNVVCGSKQEPLVRAAQHRGYSVIGIDRVDRVDFLDYQVRCSVESISELCVQVANLVSGENFSIKGVTCRSSGLACYSAEVLRRRHRCVGAGKRLAWASVCKWFLYNWLVINKVPTIYTKLLRFESELTSSYKFRGLVIKPSQPSIGKEGVSVVSSDTRKANKQIAKACYASRNYQAVVQTKIDGRDIGLCIACHRGSVMWHQMYEELNQFSPAGVQNTGIDYDPIKLKKSTEEDMLNVAKGLICIDGSSGFVFFSFKVTSAGTAFLYELNVGLSGDGIIENGFAKKFPDINFFDVDVLLMTDKVTSWPSH
jgi:hypothetical protein